MPDGDGPAGLHDDDEERAPFEGGRGWMGRGGERGKRNTQESANTKNLRKKNCQQHPSIQIFGSTSLLLKASEEVLACSGHESDGGWLLSSL